MICIENFEDTKILTDTDDKLSHDITFKNVVILMTCDMKDDDKLVFVTVLRRRTVRRIRW